MSSKLYLLYTRYQLCNIYDKILQKKIIFDPIWPIKGFLAYSDFGLQNQKIAISRNESQKLKK